MDRTVEQLEKELAALRQRNAELEAELAQSKLELEAARVDGERLDWLEGSHFDLLYTTSLMNPRWCVGADESYFEVEGPTVRAAIDAARAGKDGR